MEKITVDHNTSKQLARVLRSINIRQEFYHRPFLKNECSRISKANAYFFAVAICHQTRSLKYEQKGLAGWEVIEWVYDKLMTDNHDFINPEHLKGQSIKAIEDELCSVFSDTLNNWDCSLDRTRERASLLKDAAIKLAPYGYSFLKLLDKTSGYLFNGNKGIYTLLSGIEAFSDPHRKKTSFLLKLITDASLYEIRDMENFIPIMDYHMMRVLLRTGALSIADGHLKTSLQKREALGSDKEIRQACIESIRYIARESGKSIPSLNDYLWPLGRSCCYEYPLCKYGKCAKDPCSFYLIADISKHKECIFNGCCKAVKEQSYMDLWEPCVQTHYY